jgi:Xaa-Pro aminopeptidase
VTSAGSAWPSPADFAAPPTAADHARWAEADRSARPARLARLRARFADGDVDAYFGTRRENSRYLTGFILADGEEKVAGHSGQFLVGRDEVVVLADSRYEIQAAAEAPGARVADAGYDLPASWPELVSSLGARRVAVEAGFVSHALWRRLEAAAPDVELVPVEGWVEADRAVKESSELERVAAACAVADRALATLLPIIVPGASERSLALELEWLMLRNGAETIAFDPTCLVGPNAAMPHGSPSDTVVERGRVVLFDFGAQVDGYRSDMTRTLFCGEPGERDLAIYELVAAAQSAAIQQLTASLGAEIELPSGRDLDAIARGVIDSDGRWSAYRHGLGHGIGLATHEGPSLSRSALDMPLPSPTVFSVEPGIYLARETGVRIEDLVQFDAGAGTLEYLTRFPREVMVVGG